MSERAEQTSRVKPNHACAQLRNQEQIQSWKQARRCLDDTLAGMATEYTASLHGHDEAVSAARIRDLVWMSEQIRLRGLIWNTDDARVLATLWWYSASSKMIAPSIASLVVTGRPLSPELNELWLHRKPDSRLSGATSAAILPTSTGRARMGGGEDAALTVLGEALGRSLGEVIPSVAAAGQMRERPLWAITTDAIAGQLLWAGKACGAVDRATRMAEPLVAAIGAMMPLPRYTLAPGVERAATKRVSCCLLYRAPGQDKCRTCPGRPPGDRC